MIKGIGIDSIELGRIARIYREYGIRFLNRIYTDEERAYALRFRDPVPRLAARFAAKEACMKAIGTGWNDGVRWQDIAVVNSGSGKPELRLSGRARYHMERVGARSAQVSITHDRERAMVIVILE